MLYNVCACSFQTDLVLPLLQKSNVCFQKEVHLEEKKQPHLFFVLFLKCSFYVNGSIHAQNK